MHKNHRKRLKARFLKEGLSGFEPHNVLELLLFYSIPQKDTNETAHMLIERFGSLNGVFDAPFDELIKVPGIKEHSATLIKLLPEIAERYVDEASPFRKQILSSSAQIGEFFKNKYVSILCETVFLLLLDGKHHLIDCVKIYEGCINSSALTMRMLIEPAIAKKAAFAAIAHNHPEGIAFPSPDDLFTTDEAMRSFSLVGVELMAHILVSGDNWVDILNQ